MSIKLNGSNSGSVEIDVPADAGLNTAITFPATSGTVDRLERAGNILQVVQTVKTDVFSEAESSAPAETGDITGLTASITPASTSNKVLVSGVISWGTDNITIDQVGCRLYRGTTRLTTGDADGSTAGVMGGGHLADGNRSPGLLVFSFLDSPNTTSEVTYSVRLVNQFSANVTLYVNRGGDTLDNGTRTRGISTITAMEVAG